MKKNVLDRTEYASNLVNDLRALIASTRDEVARSVNSALVLLYWKVGKRIRQDILMEKRAEYGEEILPTLSAKLVTESGMDFPRVTLLAWCALPRYSPTSKLYQRCRRN